MEIKNHKQIPVRIHSSPQTTPMVLRNHSFPTISFERILTSEELKQSGTALNNLWKLLNKKITVLIPESALPTPLYGSRNSKEGIGFYKFWSHWGHGFLDLPRGKTSHNIYKEGHSPYAASNFSRNPLSIALERLTNRNYATILKKNDFEDFYRESLERVKQSANMTDYEYIYTKQEEILKKAWESFKKRSLLTKHKIKISPQDFNKQDMSALKKLNRDFSHFKKQNEARWLEKDSLFYALQKLHKEEDFTKWGNELDKNLFRWLEGKNKNDLRYREYAKKRLQELKSPFNKQFIDDQEFYKFTQFILEKQEKETAKIINKPFGVDIPTGQSQIEEWSYPHAFLKDYKVGVEPEVGNPDGQVFVFKALDLTKTFIRNAQGKYQKNLLGKPKLDVTGQFLNNKFDLLFERNRGSVRVDFPRGYVNPLIVKSTAPNASFEHGARRLFTSPSDSHLKPFSLIPSHLTDPSKSPLDPTYVKKDIFQHEHKKIVNQLAQVFDHIFKPLLKKYKVKSNQFHLEMLGPQPNEFLAVAENRKKMAGKMHIGQYMQSKDLPLVRINDQMVIANHDTKSIFKWAEDLIHDPQLKNDLEIQVNDLASLLKMDKTILMSDPHQLAKAKIVQGLISKAGEFVIDWQSIFMNTADKYKKRYNSFETVDIAKKSNNFRLKLDHEWLNDYYKGLEDNKALNIFEVALDVMKVKRAEILKKLGGKNAVEKYNSLFKEIEYWKNELLIPEPINYIP